MLLESKEKRFRSLYDKANTDFTDFIYKWEQHEIVFKPLLPQRYAISEEYEEAINNDVGIVLCDFERYLMSIQSGFVGEDKETLIAKMEDGYNRCSTITNCLCDIRNNLQNYVYGNILNTKNEPRRVADTNKYLTISTLMKKHKSKLEFIKNLNKPKSLPHRIWKRFLDFKNKTG